MKLTLLKDITETINPFGFGVPIGALHVPEDPATPTYNVILNTEDEDTITCLSGGRPDFKFKASELKSKPMLARTMLESGVLELFNSRNILFEFKDGYLSNKDHAELRDILAAAFAAHFKGHAVGWARIVTTGGQIDNSKGCIVICGPNNWLYRTNDICLIDIQLMSSRDVNRLLSEHVVKAKEGFKKAMLSARVGQ